MQAILAEKFAFIVPSTIFADGLCVDNIRCILAALHFIPDVELVPLYISADGGDTWYNRTPGIVDYIAMNDDGSIIFVACHSGESLEIYYTVDFGESWVQPMNIPWGDFFTDAEISGDGSKFFVGIDSTIK